MQIACLSHVQLQPPSSFFEEKKEDRVRKTLTGGFTSLLVKTCTVPSRDASWILGALRPHTRYRSRLKPQRYSVHDPCTFGYALALTNTIT